MKRNWMLAAVVCLASAVTASAYEINWSTPDAGGVSSRIGYELHGAIGQSDAGTLSAAGYTLNGGFITTNAAASVQPPCAGDTNGDDMVDLSDLALLLSVFGSCEGDMQYVPAADFDNTGCVELGDLALLLSVFGANCQ
ncbi:MAG: hypothetical protein KDA32_15175 [Phycisphaerales bacterium]|nr:hypothetical protein [Phycisphaerales bacterium]